MITYVRASTCVPIANACTYVRTYDYSYHACARAVYILRPCAAAALSLQLQQSHPRARFSIVHYVLAPDADARMHGESEPAACIYGVSRV